MRKKTIAIISAVAAAILILVFVLSSEITGVPKKQVEADIDKHCYYTPRNITLKHDVDLSLHTDTVTVKYDSTHTYATCHWVYEFQYFHNRSLDIWELEDTEFVSREYDLRKTLDGKVFNGQDSSFSSILNYRIEVYSIADDNCSVYISYIIKDNKYTYRDFIQLGINETYKVTDYISIAFTPDGIKAYYSR